MKVKDRPNVTLPVLAWAAPEAAPAPVAAPAYEADPFNPHKILNHFDRIQRLVKGEVVSPITVEIDPTNLCNHRCAWCVSMESHTGEVLSIERLRELIGELRAADVRSIVLKGGGEPTTHPQFLEILDAVKESGLSCGLITNGSMPRKGTRERIVQTCEWVRFSLDAATPQTHRAIHGTSDFTRILQNVEYLATHASGKTMVGLNFVAEGRNHQEMAEFARMGKALGAAYVTIRCVFDPNNPLSDETRAAMRQQAAAAKAVEDGTFRVFLGNFTDRYLNADAAEPFPYDKCLGPNLIGVVGGDGEVYACCFLRGNKQFSFGNIHEKSFDEIWKSERRQAVMNAVYRGACGRACAGGMTANRYNTYNEILNYLMAEEKKHANFA